MDKIYVDVVPENRSIADWEWYEAHGEKHAIAYMKAYRNALNDPSDPCHIFAKQGASMTKNFLDYHERPEEATAETSYTSKIRLSQATYPITTQSLNALIDKINELEDRLEKIERAKQRDET